MEDRIAVSRLKQGNLTGLESLVNRYQVQAVHAAYLIVNDRALAEDLAQTAFVKAMEYIHQFDEERPFAPWFFRIVVNDALKIATRQNRNVSLAKWLTDPGLQPEQLVEQKETHENILKAIQSLLPEQRAVIVMRYYLDMSEADMSAKLERPLSSIKWWLRDARKHLYDLMRTKAEGE